MAPDISQLPQNSGLNGTNRDDVSNAPGEQFEIPQTTLYDPANRKVKVLTIGAGVSGIMMTYKIQKELEGRNIEHVLYEKNADIGGTWFENRYPGCACDVPSHAYTFNFALNADWPKFFSYSKDIWGYLDRVCKCFDLRKYMNFNTEVIGCYWNEDEGQWTVKLKQRNPGSEVREFEEKCDVLLQGIGVLNNFKWPNIEGLDKFKGKVIHTARWPEDYKEEQWAKDRVALIGSGASSIQTVPTMQPHVKHMDIFVRTGVWFVQLANNYGINHEYTDEERENFRTDLDALVDHAKDIEGQINGIWGGFYRGSELQDTMVKMWKERMAEFIKDERLLKGFTPKFGVGCRRVTPGDPYMKAIQNENIDVHFTAVTKVTEDGVVGADGEERKCDVIICATGFDTSYRPRFPIVGKNGVDLAKKWKICPESYLGLAVPDMPNFYTFIGPTWPVENGSVMGPLASVGDYVIKAIKKIQNDQIKSLVPKQGITDQFNAHVQKWIKHTIWTDDCRSWYKDNETGRVNAIWPGSSLHYIHTIEDPRYEDYEIEYKNAKNPWEYLGIGYSMEEKIEKSDRSPYISKETIDPKWIEASKVAAKA